MRNLLAVLPAAALLAVLAPGCGDTCSTKGAPLDRATSGNCSTIAAGGTTVRAPLCQRCTDTSPSCQVEVVDNTIQIDATMKECDSDKGCGDPSCATPRPAVNCVVPPLTGTSYTLQFIGASGQDSYPVTVSASGTTTCTL